MSFIRSLVTLGRKADRPDVTNLADYAAYLVWQGFPEREIAARLSHAASQLEARRQAEWDATARARREQELLEMRAEGLEAAVARVYARLNWNESGGPDGSGPTFSTVEQPYEASPEERFLAGEWVNGG